MCILLFGTAGITVENQEVIRTCPKCLLGVGVSTLMEGGPALWEVHSPSMMHVHQGQCTLTGDGAGSLGTVCALRGQYMVGPPPLSMDVSVEGVGYMQGS